MLPMNQVGAGCMAPGHSPLPLACSLYVLIVPAAAYRSCTPTLGSGARCVQAAAGKQQLDQQAGLALHDKQKQKLPRKLQGLLTHDICLDRKWVRWGH